MLKALLLSIIDFKRKQLRIERLKKSTCPQLVTEHPVTFNKTSCQILMFFQEFCENIHLIAIFMLSPYKKNDIKVLHLNPIQNTYSVFFSTKKCAFYLKKFNFVFVS